MPFYGSEGRGGAPDDTGTRIAAKQSPRYGNGEGGAKHPDVITGHLTSRKVDEPDMRRLQRGSRASRKRGLVNAPSQMKSDRPQNEHRFHDE